MFRNRGGNTIDGIVSEYAASDEHEFFADLRHAVSVGRRACAVLEVLAGTYLDENESDAFYKALFLHEGDLDAEVTRLIAKIGLQCVPRGASP